MPAALDDGSVATPSPAPAACRAPTATVLPALPVRPSPAAPVPVSSIFVIAPASAPERSPLPREPRLRDRLRPGPEPWLEPARSPGAAPPGWAAPGWAAPGRAGTCWAGAGWGRAGRVSPIFGRGASARYALPGSATGTSATPGWAADCWAGAGWDRAGRVSPIFGRGASARYALPDSATGTSATGTSATGTSATGGWATGGWATGGWVSAGRVSPTFGRGVSAAYGPPGSAARSSALFRLRRRRALGDMALASPVPSDVAESPDSRSGRGGREPAASTCPGAAS